MNLSVQNLTKCYGKKTALNGLNLSLNNGVYALLGPNGAGKTTFINMLVGILRPTAGTILYNGKSVAHCEREYLSKIGYLPQMPSFYKQFTAEDFLIYMSFLKDIPKGEIKQKTARLLESVHLIDVSNKKISSFSGGMRQRLGIAQALINDPELLILDEPTAGLDPKERIRFQNILTKLSGERIILLATHIVSDVECLADWIILLKNGNLICVKKPATLLNEIKQDVWEFTVDEGEFEKYLNAYNVSNVTRNGGRYKLHIVTNDKPCESAVNVAPTLNDVYLKYFGEENKHEPCFIRN